MGLGRGLVEGLVGVNIEEDREEVLRELGNDGAELEIVSFDMSMLGGRDLRLRRWSGDHGVRSRRSR